MKNSSIQKQLAFHLIVESARNCLLDSLIKEAQEAPPVQSTQPKPEAADKKETPSQPVPTPQPQTAIQPPKPPQPPVTQETVKTPQQPATTEPVKPLQQPTAQETPTTPQQPTTTEPVKPPEPTTSGPRPAPSWIGRLLLSRHGGLDEPTLKNLDEYTKLFNYHSILLGLTRSNPRILQALEDASNLLQKYQQPDLDIKQRHDVIEAFRDRLIDAAQIVSDSLQKNDTLYYNFARAYRALNEGVVSGQLDLSQLDVIRSLLFLMYTTGFTLPGFRENDIMNLYFKLTSFRNFVKANSENQEVIKQAIISLIPTLDRFKQQLYRFRASKTENPDAFLATLQAIETGKDVPIEEFSIPESVRQSQHFKELQEADIRQQVPGFILPTQPPTSERSEQIIKPTTSQIVDIPQKITEDEWKVLGLKEVDQLTPEQIESLKSLRNKLHQWAYFGVTTQNPFIRERAGKAVRFLEEAISNPNPAIFGLVRDNIGILLRDVRNEVILNSPRFYSRLLAHRMILEREINKKEGFYLHPIQLDGISGAIYFFHNLGISIPGVTPREMTNAYRLLRGASNVLWDAKKISPEVYQEAVTSVIRHLKTPQVWNSITKVVDGIINFGRTVYPDKNKFEAELTGFRTAIEHPERFTSSDVDLILHPDNPKTDFSADAEAWRNRFVEETEHPYVFLVTPHELAGVGLRPITPFPEIFELSPPTPDVTRLTRRVEAPRIEFPPLATPEVKPPSLDRPEGAPLSITFEDIERSLEKMPLDWTQRFYLQVDRGVELRRYLKDLNSHDIQRRREASFNIRTKFRDLVEAYNFLNNTGLRFFEQGKLIDLTPEEREQARKHFGTIMRYGIILKALEDLPDDISVEQITEDVFNKIFTSKLVELIRQTYDGVDLTEANYRSVLRDLEKMGLEVQSEYVPRQKFKPRKLETKEEVSKPEPVRETKKAPGIWGFLSSLSPLSLIAVLLGVPIGAIGLLQVLIKDSTAGYVMAGLGTLLTFLGFMGVEKVLGLQK